MESRAAKIAFDGAGWKGELRASTKAEKGKKIELGLAKLRYSSGSLTSKNSTDSLALSPLHCAQLLELRKTFFNLRLFIFIAMDREKNWGDEN